jgi:hypothetical protein
MVRMGLSSACTEEIANSKNKTKKKDRRFIKTSFDVKRDA